MSLVQRVRDAFAVLAGKQQMPPVGAVFDIPDYQIGWPWALTEQQLTHRDAFRRIPIVNAVVSMIADDCASLPKRFKQGKGQSQKEIERFPGNIVDVWEGANTRDTGLQLTRGLHGEYELIANAYMFLERGKGAGPSVKPYAVWSMPAAQVEPIPGPGRQPEGYAWLRGGERQFVEPWKIIHFAGFNPFDEPIGIGWMEAAKEDYEAQFYALQLLKEFYRHGGISPGIYGRKDPANTAPLKPEEIKAKQAAYRQMIQRPRDAWNLQIMDEMEQIAKGQTLSELQLDKMISLVNANICRSAGVPPRMLGINETDSLGNGKPSEISTENYWRGTIGRRTRLFDSILNERFCPLYGRDITVETDMSAVPALQASRLEMMNSAVKACGRAVAAVNEVRPWVGLEPHEDASADELYTAPTPTFGAGVPGDTSPPADQPPVPKKKAEQRLSLARGRVDVRAREEAKLRRYERRVERHLIARWERQAPEVIASFERQARAAGIDVEAAHRPGSPLRFTIDPSDSLPPAPNTDLEALQLLFEQMVLDRGEEAFAEVGLELTLETLKSRIATLVGAKSGQLITNVDQATRDQMAQIAAEWMRAGEPFSVLTARVRAAFEGFAHAAGGQQSRAATVARTETAWAYNYAAVEAWKLAGVEQKEWLTVGDDAVRDSHRACEAEGVIPFDQAFSNGLQYPGEPGGDASEVINCRCLLQPVVEVPVQESLGWWTDERPVRKPVNRLARVLDEHRNGVAA